jgi:23S rRNA (adenine2503-C2)-methyltransferase
LGLGGQRFHARQIFNWIYQKGVWDFSKMSNLPVGLRQRLQENFYIRGLKLARSLKSKDGTEKFLLEAQDKNLIECVRIPAAGRVAGCVSSQAGCKYACGFCASGISGFKRNLSVGEIIEQVLYLKPTHVVFMGSGEPLDNYDNVLKAIRIINSKEALHIGSRRITISTCGIIPGIKKLAQEKLQIELSVSLHAADEKTRSSLMPVNKKYPLGELIQACREYIHQTNRQITFEYVLIRGLNTDLVSAQNLAKIVKSLGLAKVNLIAANPVKELKAAPPDKAQILYFENFLKKAGVRVTLRSSRGEDIQAACGQLRLRYEKR